MMSTTACGVIAGFCLLLGVTDAVLAQPTNIPTAVPRIVVRNGHFVVQNTGTEFSPVGANFFQVAPVTDSHPVHATFCPGVYDPAWMEQMLADLAAHGMNTVRTFQVYAVGERGILKTKDAREISPDYLANVLHFLWQARQKGIYVIFTWDSWLPDSDWWSQEPLPGEGKYHFDVSDTPANRTNNAVMTLRGARVRAHAITALIEAIRKADPGLLPVVLAWELQNELGFDSRAEPFVTRSSSFDFAGKTYDLGKDPGVQDFMDDCITHWSNFCAEQVHLADPETLVSVSVFPFAAVHRIGPGQLSKDVTTDPRIPGRPLALVRSSLDFTDLHIYASKRGPQTYEQAYQEALASDESPALQTEAARLGKPLLIGETGVFKSQLKGTSEKNRVNGPNDYQSGLKVLREFAVGLRKSGFVGALYWHYGWRVDPKEGDSPQLAAFPELENALTAPWQGARTHDHRAMTLRGDGDAEARDIDKNTTGDDADMTIHR